MTPLTHEQRRDVCAAACRIEIRSVGQSKGRTMWYWAAHSPDGMLRDGLTDDVAEAAVLAKYALFDYVDAVTAE